MTNPIRFTMALPLDVRLDDIDWEPIAGRTPHHQITSFHTKQRGKQAHEHRSSASRAQIPGGPDHGPIIHLGRAMPM